VLYLLSLRESNNTNALLRANWPAVRCSLSAPPFRPPSRRCPRRGVRAPGCCSAQAILRSDGTALVPAEPHACQVSSAKTPWPVVDRGKGRARTSRGAPCGGLSGNARRSDTGRKEQQRDYVASLAIHEADLLLEYGGGPNAQQGHSTRIKPVSRHLYGSTRSEFRQGSSSGVKGAVGVSSGGGQARRASCRRSSTRKAPAAWATERVGDGSGPSSPEKKRRSARVGAPPSRYRLPCLRLR